MLLGANTPSWADDPPTGYSHSPQFVIGGVADGDATQRYNVLVPLEGSTTVQKACARGEHLWVQGETQPRTCAKMTVDEYNGLLQLALSQAVSSPYKGVENPPILLSTQPFPVQRFAERPMKSEELEAVRTRLPTLSLPEDISKSMALKKGTALDTQKPDLTYIFVPGRHLQDSNASDECATTSILVFAKTPQGITYSGELKNHPSSFVQNAATSSLDAVVSINCGKELAIVELTPKVNEVVTYSNGYEYGP